MMGSLMKYVLFICLSAGPVLGLRLTNDLRSVAASMLVIPELESKGLTLQFTKAGLPFFPDVYTVRNKGGEYFMQVSILPNKDPATGHITQKDGPGTAKVGKPGKPKDAAKVHADLKEFFEDGKLWDTVDNGGEVLKNQRSIRAHDAAMPTTPLPKLMASPTTPGSDSNAAFAPAASTTTTPELLVIPELPGIENPYGLTLRWASHNGHDEDIYHVEGMDGSLNVTFSPNGKCKVSGASMVDASAEKILVRAFLKELLEGDKRFDVEVGGEHKIFIRKV